MFMEQIYNRAKRPQHLLRDLTRARNTACEESIHKTEGVNGVAFYLCTKAQMLADCELVRTCSTVLKDIQRYKSRIKHFSYKNRIKHKERFANRNAHWTNRFVVWLETAGEGLQLIVVCRTLPAHLPDVTRQIRELSRQEDFQGKMSNLLSIIERTGELTFRRSKNLCKKKKLIAHKLSDRILSILKSNTKYVYETNK